MHKPVNVFIYAYVRLEKENWNVRNFVNCDWRFLVF